MTTGDKQALVVLGVVVVGGVIVYFVFASKPKKAASSGGAGLTDAVCAAGGAALLGIPIPPGLCGALAPFMKDGAQIAGTAAIQNLRDVADVETTLVHTGAGVAKQVGNDAWEVAKYGFYVGTPVGNASLAIKGGKYAGEKVVAGSEYVGGKVADGAGYVKDKVVSGAESVFHTLTPW